MSFTKLLTIAIPCYERKEYFLEAVESALAQTIKCEVIVVDNCSSHDFFEKTCIGKGVTYFRNETNIGLFPNQNKCYALAKTEYVKVLDSDDLLSPIYVESFLKAIELHPDIDVYYSDFIELTSYGECSHKDKFPLGYMEKGIKIIEYGIKYRLAFPYMTSTIKRIKAQLDVDINLCAGGYDWVWIYSNADQLSFYGDSGKHHQLRLHTDNSSKKDWIPYLLTTPYIYETILLEKLSNSKLKKKLKRKVFFELINLKSQATKGELIAIMNSENRFGKYLIDKLNRNVLLMITFKLPYLFIRIVILPIKLINWLCRRIFPIRLMQN